MIKIDKNIAPPINGTTIGVALGKLEVNDSFFLDDATNSVRQAIHLQMKKQKDRTFMTRSEDEGIRVWRLA